MASVDGQRWITINGTHIFIKDGQSVGDAFKKTTGKELKSKSSGGKKSRSASEVEGDYKRLKKSELEAYIGQNGYLTRTGNLETRLESHLGLDKYDPYVSSGIEEDYKTHIMTVTKSIWNEKTDTTKRVVEKYKPEVMVKMVKNDYGDVFKSPLEKDIKLIWKKVKK